MKGATGIWFGSPATSNAISIHAPVKGATQSGDCPSRVAENFNPRSREGSDPDEEYNDFSDKISIHAPVKGATLSV